MTDSLWLNLHIAKILGFQSLNDRFVTPVRDSLRQVVIDLYGPDDGTLDLDGDGQVTFTATGALADLDAPTNEWVGFDGLGNRLALLEEEGPVDPWHDIPFGNSGATVYYFAAYYYERPVAAELNADGTIGYSHSRETVGYIQAVTTATDLGNGNVRLEWTDAAWGTNTAPRHVFVWFDLPLTAGAQAVTYAEAVYHAGSGNIRVELAGALGQAEDDIDTDETLYQVLVTGPKITTSSPVAVSGAWTLGTITSGVWSGNLQTLFPTFGDLTNLTTQTRRIVIDGASFRAQIPDAQQGTIIHTDPIGLTINASAAAYYTGSVPIEIPHGATIVELELDYQLDDADPATPYTTAYINRAQQNGGSAGIASVTGDVNDSATHQVTDSVSIAVNRELYSYDVSLLINPTDVAQDHIVYAVIVTYEIPWFSSWGGP